MRISDYRKQYTNGDPIYFKYVLGEVGELWEEVIKWNVPAMKEEWEDVLHFVQLWLHSQCNIDTDVWHVTRHSVDKFIKRNGVWREMYAYAGLPSDTPGYGGNYNRLHKVVHHLGRLGVSKEKAEEIYKKFVVEKE
jgi:hypothetical protein